MRLVIKRSEWLRGEGSDASYLLRSSDGKRCCVGHYLRACGVPDEWLADRASPIFDPGSSRSRLSIPEAPGWLYTCDGHRVTNSNAAAALYSANDARHESADREAFIIQQFARHGVEVTFVD